MHTRQYVIVVNLLVQSGVGKSRKCCFQVYAPQTKILEGVTKDEMWIFEALFKGVSTQFGPQTIEKCDENILPSMHDASLVGWPNPAWVSLGNVVSHVASQIVLGKHASNVSLYLPEGLLYALLCALPLYLG